MSFRIEKKFFIKKENLFDFKKELFSKNFKKLYQPRLVSSIYFDNNHLDMFNESVEGLTPRKKIRVRNYPNLNSSFFLLENKISSIEGRFKTSKKMSKNKFEYFIKNGILDKTYGICKPIIKIVYLREYLAAKDIRITIDTKINYNLFNKKEIKEDQNIIVELKTTIDKNLDELLENLPYQETRFSKYCNGLEIFKKD